MNDDYIIGQFIVFDAGQCSGDARGAERRGDNEVSEAITPDDLSLTIEPKKGRRWVRYERVVGDEVLAVRRDKHGPLESIDRPDRRHAAYGIQPARRIGAKSSQSRRLSRAYAFKFRLKGSGRLHHQDKPAAC